MTNPIAGRRLLAALSFSALLGAAAGVSFAAVPAAIGIDNFSFTPSTLDVPVGATVTWTNHDDVPHIVADASDARLFKSAPLDTGEHFSFIFTKSGTYRFFCTIHPRMTGTIIVYDLATRGAPAG